MPSLQRRALPLSSDGGHLGRVKPAMGAAPNTDAGTATDYVAERRPSSNRRNGCSRKTIRSESGEITLRTPRDREGTFEPLLIPKHSRHLARFDEKILALFAKGLSTRDIQELLKSLYGVELSPTLISSISDAAGEEAAAWRWRMKWSEIIPLFDFPWPIRKAIATTNAIRNWKAALNHFAILFEDRMPNQAN